MRPAKLGTLLLGASLPVAGCVCQEGGTASRASPPPRELAFWDFAHPADLPKITLWPPGTGAPNRRKHQLLTRQEGTDLVATTDGPDPWLVWDFESPERGGALSVELDSDTPGELQLFWANSECKVYQERCNATRPLGTGRQVIDFLLDAARDTVGIRLDLPQQRGITLRIHAISLLGRPRLGTGWTARQNHTEAAQTPGGLRLTCKSPDPWIQLSTPWLDTSQAEAVEVRLGAPPGAEPELFWAGDACQNFEEKCKVKLERDDGGGTLFVARLAGVGSWRGRAHDVRLDPGEPAGEYLVESITFVRTGDLARRGRD